MGLHPLEVVGTAVVESTRTLVRHYVKAKEQQELVPARKELLFDEAFHISKTFLERAMSHSVESIQLFGHARVPAPPWVAIHRVDIPISLCDAAADIIIRSLGEDEIENVVGGKTWWQQRIAKTDGAGVEAEWIWIKSQEQARRREQAKKEAAAAQTKKEKQPKPTDDDKDSTDEADDEYTARLDDQRCMFYVHGGGYYFGSIDVYRYTLWRYARKIGGRAFAVKYRLAPQYPFPCALQDALAAYLYLIRPPPGAKHKPVDPRRMVVAGDSAGGGLALALMCLIRDMKLPLPAGIVLISPWLDLTHSFPSILQNTATDIIPPYGFLHKPSVLWPPPSRATQDKIRGYTSVKAIKERAASQSSNSRKSSGWSGVKNLVTAVSALSTSSLSSPTSKTSSVNSSSSSSPSSSSKVNEKVEPGPMTVLADDKRDSGRPFVVTEEPESLTEPVSPNDDDKLGEGRTSRKDATSIDKSTQNTRKESQARTEPEDVTRMLIDGKEVELKDQIQFYAMNSQLTYPYVSPVLQPSLGGLPEMLVICGDKEVLRDEIIYCAHKAAHPELYPLRQPLRDMNKARAALGDTYGPTKVHLQVYDDMPHDLVLFSMANSANYAYRAIASFCKAVTTPEEERLPKSLEPIHELDPNAVGRNDPLKEPQAALYQHGRILSPPSQRKLTPEQGHALQSTIYSPLHPFHRPEYEDNMIRERVAIDGTIRPLEDAKDLQACRMHQDDIGLIKEGPVKRYLQGKARWDKKYPAKRIESRRKRNVKQAAKDEAKRLAEKASSSSHGHHKNTQDCSTKTSETDETLTDEELLSTWARIDGEKPPPSSLAARRDTTEALRMAAALRSDKSRTNPITLWTGMHDLVSLFPNKRNADKEEDGQSEGSSESADTYE